MHLSDLTSARTRPTLAQMHFHDGAIATLFRETISLANECYLYSTSQMQRSNLSHDPANERRFLVLFWGQSCASHRPLLMKNLDASQVALSVVNHIPAMVAYWDSEQRCVFSNDAYQKWFGRSPEQMRGMSLRELLGPIYEMNLPYITGALQGARQVFERQIKLPGGEVRETIATYTPDVVEGMVRGFSVHVADVTPLREREVALEQAVRERDSALAEVRTLRGLLPICSYCKAIRDEKSNWMRLEAYIATYSKAELSHGICPDCTAKHFANLFADDPRE